MDETNSPKKTYSYDKVKWAKSANKGDWSELYTLYKLLVDQNLYPINTAKSRNGLRLPILSLLRYTNNKISTEYRIDEDGNIKINANGEKIIDVRKTDFESNAANLLREIQNAKINSFEISSLDDFRKLTCCPQIKCHSRTLEHHIKDKSDLYIVIHDTMTGQTPKLGFSIKSELGEPPTLLNATNLTNFRYKLTKKLSVDKVNEINSMFVRKNQEDIKGRVKAIYNEGATLVFDSILPNKDGQEIFLENLILIDSSMHEIIAHLLLLSYLEKKRSLDFLTDILSKNNPLKFPMKTNQKCYEAKVKRFVTDVALGMIPSQPWDATPQAAGVLVVREKEGNIDCYHLLYKEALDDYLYHSLKFETGSVKRYNFGKIENEHGNQYFTLNLQLRFIK